MMSSTLKKILVAIDLSSTSLNALETAIALAKKNNSELLVVHVKEKMEGYCLETINGNTNHDVLTALTGSIEHKQKVRIRLFELAGHVVENIIVTAQEEKADLIVVGTHGASGFREGFMGSNAYNIFKYAPCHTLSIPGTKKYETFEKVLYPIRPGNPVLMEYENLCHFLSGYSMLKLLWLSGLDIKTEAGILEKIESKIREKLHEENIQLSISRGNGNYIADEILSTALSETADLIFLANQPGSISKSKYIGPHTQKLLHAAKMPILNIKAGATAF